MQIMYIGLEIFLFILLAYWKQEEFILFVRCLWNKEVEHTAVHGWQNAVTIFLVSVAVDVIVKYVLLQFVAYEWLIRFPMYFGIFCDFLVVFFFVVALIRGKYKYGLALIVVYAVLSILYVKIMAYFATDIDKFLSFSPYFIG